MNANMYFIEDIVGIKYFLFNLCTIIMNKFILCNLIYLHLT